MVNRDYVSSVSPHVTPLAVRDYVKFTQWKEVDGIKGRYWVYTSPIDDDTQVIIPKDVTPDYSRVIWEILTRISEVQGLSVVRVLDFLLNPSSDIIRFHVEGPDYSSGTLPMIGTKNLIDGAKMAILASACSVSNKATHHPRMSFRQAEDLLDVCQFGQTEVGSYIIKLVLPLNKMGEPPMIEDGFPFARDTTQLLMESADMLVTAIEEDSVETLVEEQTIKPVLSSNLCDAILLMHGGLDKGSLAISAAWAPVVKCGSPSVSSFVRFKQEYFPVVAEVSARLKPPEKEKIDKFVGTVETMSGSVGEGERRSGDVTLAILVEGESVKAKANLEYDDYHTAWQAHDGDVKYVTFNAKLVRKPGKGTDLLQDVSDFKLLRMQE